MDVSLWTVALCGKRHIGTRTDSQYDDKEGGDAQLMLGIMEHVCA